MLHACNYSVQSVFDRDFLVGGLVVDLVLCCVSKWDVVIITTTSSYVLKAGLVLICILAWEVIFLMGVVLIL